MLIDVGRKDAATNLQVSKYFYEIGDGENASRIKAMASGQQAKESGHSSVETGTSPAGFIRLIVFSDTVLTGRCR